MKAVSKDNPRVAQQYNQDNLNIPIKKLEIDEGFYQGTTEVFQNLVSQVQQGMPTRSVTPPRQGGTPQTIPLQTMVDSIVTSTTTTTTTTTIENIQSSNKNDDFAHAYLETIQDGKKILSGLAPTKKAPIEEKIPFNLMKLEEVDVHKANAIVKSVAVITNSNLENEQVDIDKLYSTTENIVWLKQQEEKDNALIGEAKIILQQSNQLKEFYELISIGVDKEEDFLAKKFYAYNSLEKQLTAYQDIFASASLSNIGIASLCDAIKIKLDERLKADDDSFPDPNFIKKTSFLLGISLEKTTALFAGAIERRKTILLLSAKCDPAKKAVDSALNTYRSKYSWLHYCCKYKVRPKTYKASGHTLKWGLTSNGLDEPLNFVKGFLVDSEAQKDIPLTYSLQSSGEFTIPSVDKSLDQQSQYHVENEEESFTQNSEEDKT